MTLEFWDFSTWKFQNEDGGKKKMDTVDWFYEFKAILSPKAVLWQ